MRGDALSLGRARPMGPLCPCATVGEALPAWRQVEACNRRTARLLRALEEKGPRAAGPCQSREAGAGRSVEMAKLGSSFIAQVTPGSAAGRLLVVGLF